MRRLTAVMRRAVIPAIQHDRIHTTHRKELILRNHEEDYAYLQIAYTIAQSQETEEREYRPLEMIKDNYPKCLLTTDYLLQKRNGIKHVNLVEQVVRISIFSALQIRAAIDTFH